MAIKQNCRELAGRYLELEHDLHEHYLAVMGAMTSPHRAKTEIFSQLDSNIEGIGDYYPDLPVARTVKLDLQSLREEIARMKSPDTPLKAGTAYSKIMNETVLDAMLEAVTRC